MGESLHEPPSTTTIGGSVGSDPEVDSFMTTKTKRKNRDVNTGRLRIGDDWNAISIIALSQSNPLKAVAEFVENSIDAGAKHVKIVRGKQKGQPYLKIVDDGTGIPLDDEGKPNFKYVATHICDSIKRQLKAAGTKGVQGEFGIGLLSFWTVGETLSIASCCGEGKLYEMQMAKGDPNYSVRRLRRLMSETGTELTIVPLLRGIRGFSGEKLQSYLAAELRDRIRQSGVEVRIVDRQARAEFVVEPRAFSGQLLHNIPAINTPFGEAYVEIYLAGSDGDRSVGLYRSGTRVCEAMTDIEAFRRTPWNGRAMEGLVDAPFLNLSPGTRLGVIHDERLDALVAAMQPLEAELENLIEQQRKAAEEQANQSTLKSIQRAFREALISLPEEEYDWFDVAGAGSRHPRRTSSGVTVTDGDAPGNDANGAPTEATGNGDRQPEFFERAGPLFRARISPKSTTLQVGKQKGFRAIARDRAGRPVDDGLRYAWRVIEGDGKLEDAEGEIAIFHAPAEPQLVKLGLCVSQDDQEAEAEALITVTESLLPELPKSDAQRGLPDYTFEKRPGDLWRSRFDVETNVIVINNGHRDFVYAAQSRTVKLRYICRLFAKELVQHNFPGISADQLLERMIEVLLYTEENLR